VGKGPLADPVSSSMAAGDPRNAHMLPLGPYRLADSQPYGTRASSSMRRRNSARPLNLPLWYRIVHSLLFAVVAAVDILRFKQVTRHSQDSNSKAPRDRRLTLRTTIKRNDTTDTLSSSSTYNFSLRESCKWKS
jgi:hypothetical protein